MSPYWGGSMDKHPGSWNSDWPHTRIVLDPHTKGALLVRKDDLKILATRENVADLDYLQTHVESLLGSLEPPGAPPPQSIGDATLEAEIWSFLQELDGQMPSGPPRYTLISTDEDEEEEDEESDEEET